VTVFASNEAARHAGQSLLSFQRWKSRMILWTAGAAIGAAAVGFATMADFAQGLQRRVLAHSSWWTWALAPFGFAACAWITRRYFRGAEGSGIPQTIFALRGDAGEVGQEFLRPKVAIGRIVLAGVGLLSGASVGREGPTVHIGACIARAFARFMPHGDAAAQQRALVLAGGAAGVAAAFNTPLAGIVFGIEELARSFEERASGTTLTAVVLAGVVAIAMVGDYTYFGQPMLIGRQDLITVGVLSLALASGLAGGLFSRITLLAVNGLPGVLGTFQRKHPVLLALLCGILVAGLGFISGDRTYGTGYVEARSILESNAHLPWFYAPARALATLVAYLSGIPAGLLAPSLSVGAGLGQMIADLTGQAGPVPFAILGMCGYLAGVTQAPLTSFVIVMEMTTQHAMVLPLMMTATIATAVSRTMTPSLYRALAQRYIAVASPRTLSMPALQETPRSDP
jgi:H+/Cl- antiporter ClcA